MTRAKPVPETVTVHIPFRLVKRGGRKELAANERIAASYLTRTMRLTQLSPDIVEAILDGRQPVDFTLETLRNPLPTEWAIQTSHLAALGRPGDA